MASCHLVFGAIGVGLGDATDLLTASYATDCAVEDIEDRIKRDQRTLELLRSYSPTIPEDETYVPNMEEIAFWLPRTEVRELWQNSTRACLEGLGTSDKSVKVLSGHLLYYSRRRNELYSAVDHAVLADHSIKGVSLLIDDIWDVFARLRTQTWLFCDERLQDFIEDICTAEERDPKKLSPAECQFLLLLWKLNCFHKLLSWRCTEMVVAEDLAKQLGVDFLLFGTKQRHEILKAWLEATGPRTIYISHPISEARRAKERGEWPQLVKEINQLPELLLTEDIVAISPTAIDELRFVEDKELQALTGDLSPRWPLVREAGSLLYRLPNGRTDSDYFHVLRPELYDYKKKRVKQISREDEDERAQNMLRSGAVCLRAIVSDQVAARDHLLVVSSKGILVYRPLYEGRLAFSGGVAAEVRHWRDLAVSDVLGRVAFVHFDEDVRLTVKKRVETREPSLADDIRLELIGRIENRLHLEHEQAQTLVVNGQWPGGGLLDTPSFDRRRDTQLCGDIKRSVKVDYVRWILTNNRDVVKLDSYGIWLFGDFNEFQDGLGAVAAFLRGSRGTSSTWQDKVDDLLPDSLLGISS